MRIVRITNLVAASFLVLCGSANGQSDCEAGVTRRLAAALQANPGDIIVTRDYSEGLFPDAVFFRAHVKGGFHTKPMVAAVAVVDGDSILVQDLGDLSLLWHRLYPDILPPQPLVTDAVRELLFQTGVLQTGDDVVQSAGDLSKSYKAFLAPGGALDAIHAPEEAVMEHGFKTDFFMRTAEGVVHYVAVASRGGRLNISREVIARVQTS